MKRRRNVRYSMTCLQRNLTENYFVAYIVKLSTYVSKKINERCAKQYLVYPPKIVKRHTFSWLFSRFDRSRTESAARVSVSDQILFEIYVWAGYILSFFSGVRGGGGLGLFQADVL